MAVKYYTCFGMQNRVTDLFLQTRNPTGGDIAAAQIRPYDGGVNPMFATHGSVDPLCDITWVLRANKDVYHPLKATPTALAIIRSEQLRTILDAVPYLGNRMYLVSLNAHPLIYADYEYIRVWGTYDLLRDDISNEKLDPYLRDSLPNAIETFDPTNMTKIFIQKDYTENYGATAVKDWVDNGNVFVNMYGAYRKYNGGGEALTTLGLTAGDLVRVIKDDICLRPLIGGGAPTEYTLTRTIANARYWSTLPTVAGWTTTVLLAYVKATVEYPFLIEMEHIASGGVIISAAGFYSTTAAYWPSILMPGWYYPIVFLQYALGKAGYLGAVPAYVQE